MESEGSVSLDGAPLGYNDPDGWRLNGSSELEILGDACDAIKEGQHEISASFPCDAVVLGPPKDSMFTQRSQAMGAGQSVRSLAHTFPSHFRS